MGKRKGWEDLSPSYRARLERSGITRETFASSDLRSARGHKATPERPTSVLSDPERFSEYNVRKTSQRSEKALRNAVKRIGERYDIDDILSKVPPNQRADFVAGWELANAEYKRGRTPSFARGRLDAIDWNYPEAERALGYYH